MSIYQLNSNIKNFKQNVNQNFYIPIEEPTTNSNTVIPNSTQELGNKDFNVSSFNNMTSLLNKKRERNEPDNVCNDDEIINDNIPNINTNNNKKSKKYKKVIFIIRKKVARKFDYDNAKYCILTVCTKSIDSLQKNIFQFVDLEEFNINATSKDKVGKNLDDIIKFCETKIKKMFCNSTQKNTKNKMEEKADRTFKLTYILEQEEKDHNIKIKLLNSIFNLPYKYFLYAFLEDYTYIIISNDNGKTNVRFSSDINPDKDSLKNCLIFEFKTYKDCFNDKYNEDQKKRYKKTMLKNVFGIN